jgi:hypothetical protein
LRQLTPPATQHETYWMEPGSSDCQPMPVADLSWLGATLP